MFWLVQKVSENKHKTKNASVMQQFKYSNFIRISQSNSVLKI